MDIERKASNETLNCEDEDTNMCSNNGQLYKPVPLVSYPEDSVDFKKSSVVSKNVTSNKDLNFRIKLGKRSISIYKPLLSLKLILFLWYGSNSYLIPFLTIYFKQRGISLAELSTAILISPIAQFFGTLLSGIIVDKTGRSKPVLVSNIILTAFSLIGILLVPPMNVAKCESELINLKCHPQQIDNRNTNTSCEVIEDIIGVTPCNVQCPENFTKLCNGQNSNCGDLAGKPENKNFSLSLHVNGSSHVKYRCYYNITYMSHENETYSWCDVPHEMFCEFSCSVDSDVKCNKVRGRNLLMMITVALYILLQVVFSIGYRILDVTVMHSVKEHNSDFGKQRVFAMAGSLVMPPIAGYLVGMNSNKDNIKFAFYLYLVISFIILMLIYKLDMRFNEPAKKMKKKTAHLLKSPDILSLAFILLVLGTARNFTTYFKFWFLEELKPSSILLGLIPAISALYGFPFLLTSNWWINKIGATQIFVLGLIGYSFNSLGYSFLINPWITLLLEATEILTYHLLWVAVVTHSHKLAPEGLTASVISVAGSIHFQIGKSTGSLIGLIMNSFGGRVAFRVEAAMCAISAVLYMFYLFIRHKYYGKELVKSKTEIKARVEENGKPKDEMQELKITEKFET